jgi:predicted transcriptional regulator
MKSKTINHLNGSVVDSVHTTWKGNKINNNRYLGVLVNSFKIYNYSIKLDYKILKNAIKLIPYRDFV